jgi:hypothetical protein
MGHRWFIFSAGERYGPWSASRIRDELRAGRIDAFDMVAVEGSEIKRPLVEVDEIFENSRIQSAAIVSDVDTLLLAAGSEPAQTNDQPPPLKSARKSSQRKPPEKSPDIQKVDAQRPDMKGTKPEDGLEEKSRPRVFEALAAKEAVLDAKDRGVRPVEPARRADGKRYMVWTSSRSSSGPHSSSEVIALWYAKKFNASCSIQKLGDGRRIGIEQFIKFYEKNQRSGSVVLREVLNAARSSNAASWWLALAVFIAVLLIVAAFLYSSSLILTSPGLDEIRPASANETAVKDALSRPVPVQPQASETAPTLPKLSQTIPQAIPRPSLEQQKVSASGDRDSPQTPRSEVTNLPTRTKKEHGRSVAVRKPVSNSKQLTRQPVANRPSPRVGSMPPPQRPIYAPSTPLVAKPGPLPKPSPADRGAVSTATPSSPGVTTKPMPLTEGQTVTLTNYRFNSEHLNACEMKCKLKMSGSRGPVIAVFFKEAFGAQFQGREAGVTVSGIIKRDQASGGLQILVQSVR